MTPEDAKFPCKLFTINEEEYFIGLFLHDAANYPTVTHSKLLVKEGESWAEIDQRDYFYDDIEGDIQPPMRVEKMILDFNKTILERVEGKPLDPDEQTARYFRLHVAVEGNQLVIND